MAVGGPISTKAKQHDRGCFPKGVSFSRRHGLVLLQYRASAATLHLGCPTDSPQCPCSLLILLTPGVCWTAFALWHLLAPPHTCFRTLFRFRPHTEIAAHSVTWPGAGVECAAARYQAAPSSCAFFDMGIMLLCGCPSVPLTNGLLNIRRGGRS